MNTTLPSWFDVNRKKDDGATLNPIEQFILDNEPAAIEDEEEFRKGLVAAINYAVDGACDDGK